MVGWFKDEGLVADSAPCVSAQENAGNPHYLATAAEHRVIRKNELVLLDLWGKLDTARIGLRRHYVDRVHGTERARRMTQGVCGDLRRARRGGDDGAGRGARGTRGARLRGRSSAARQVLIDAGYEDAILHRTGHSLGENVHGNGAHLDDYETHDERRLLPGSGFTIEPGLYFKDFGVRTEINMVWTGQRTRSDGSASKELSCHCCRFARGWPGSWRKKCRVGKRRCSIRS